MKHITFRADASLIEAARARARSEQTSLNEQFRRWLSSYALAPPQLQHDDAAIQDLRGRLRVGRSLSRDEINAR